MPDPLEPKHLLEVDQHYLQVLLWQICDTLGKLAGDMHTCQEVANRIEAAHFQGGQASAWRDCPCRWR